MQYLEPKEIPANNIEVQLTLAGFVTVVGTLKTRAPYNCLCCKSDVELCMNLHFFTTFALHETLIISYLVTIIRVPLYTYVHERQQTKDVH